ncbi:ras-related protein Rab-28 [Trichonephila clavipes]|nr:ras-related protein Rab-28 [Trichonephila clavipes]
MANDQYSSGEKQFKFLLVGGEAVGKTCIALRFIQDKFDKQYKPTIGVDFFLKRIVLPGSLNVTIQLWDIGSQSLNGEMLDKYFYGAHAILFVYDITNNESLTILEEWLKAVHEVFKEECLMPHIALLSNKVQGFNIKNRKDISYPTIIRSAIRPVPHGLDLPIPSPLDTLDNILDDLDQISHTSSDSDDGYDPSTNDPELFSQSDLNDLVRDLGLPKDTAEVLGSRLKERHLLNSSVSFSWYRFREKEFVPFFYARGGPSFLQQCTCNFGNVQNYV